MATITQSLSSMENTQYFQIELFTLLGSLLLSILLNNSWPCFIISAICFFAADSALMVESYQNVLAGSLDQASAITEASMAVILLATFVYALTKRMEPRLVKAHAATTLIFSIYLAVNGSHLWEGSVGLITSGVSNWEAKRSRISY